MSAVLGCGRSLPPRVVTSEELGSELRLGGKVVAERSGVVRRNYAGPGIGPSDLGREAALAALADAGLGPGDLDLIIFATMTPDMAFPGSACFLQDKLGCDTIGALDVRAQCAGFLFALAAADRFVRAGRATCVLVVGAEIHSAALDQSPRGAAATPYFGDGGGAVILGAAAEPGVLATVLHGDPSGLERFWCEFPASRHYPARMELAQFEAGAHFYVLDAEAVHPQAERALAEVTREALGRAGVAAESVALFVAHYFDHRVARRALEKLGIRGDRIVATAEAAGHVAAAGIPIALADAVAAGRVRRGDLVCCAAFGAGFSWAGAVIRL